MTKRDESTPLPNQDVEEYWEIVSAKRKSDGEIFSIGDQCRVPTKNKNKKITHFNINEGGALFLNFDEKDSYGLNITHAVKTSLPNQKGDVEFEWTDKLVLDFAKQYRSWTNEYDLEKFKAALKANDVKVENEDGLWDEAGNLIHEQPAGLVQTLKSKFRISRK